MYMKLGFQIADYNITSLVRGRFENHVTDGTLTDDQVGDDSKLYRYKLRQGLLSKIPFYSFGQVGSRAEIRNPRLYLLNYSLRHSWEHHGLATMKTALCLLRPVTFFPMSDVKPDNICITATSLDNIY